MKTAKQAIIPTTTFGIKSAALKARNHSVKMLGRNEISGNKEGGGAPITGVAVNEYISRY